MSGHWRQYRRTGQPDDRRIDQLQHRRRQHGDRHRHPQSTDPHARRPATPTEDQRGHCRLALLFIRALLARRDPCRLGATLSTFGLPRAPAGRTNADLIHKAYGIPGAPPQTPGSQAPVASVQVDPGEAEQTSLAVSRSFRRGVLHLDTARLARSRNGGSTAHGNQVDSDCQDRQRANTPAEDRYMPWS